MTVTSDDGVNHPIGLWYHPVQFVCRVSNRYPPGRMPKHDQVGV